MSEKSSLSHHPAPAADQLSTGMAAFLLYTGPAAWFVQLCTGEILTSWPCFPTLKRLDEPLAGYDWTRTAAIVVLLVCAALAAASGVAAWHKLQSVMGEREGGHADLIEIGHGRTRFVALWGTILGVGFTVATLVTLVAFILVPRCLG